MLTTRSRLSTWERPVLKRSPPHPVAEHHGHLGGLGALGEEVALVLHARLQEKTLIPDAAVGNAGRASAGGVVELERGKAVVGLGLVVADGGLGARVDGAVPFEPARRGSGGVRVPCRGSQVSRQRQRQRGQSMLTVGVDVVPAGLVAELEALAVDHLGVEVALRVREAGVGVAALSPEWRVRAEGGAECRANEP